MKKTILISTMLALFSIIVLMPGNNVNAATVCCRGRCLPAGGWTGWFESANCSFEIHDWCGMAPYKTETAALPCAY